jgi:hypothetical protein
MAMLPAGSLRAEKNETTLISRLGMRERATFHYLEALQTHGRWVIADVGYLDFGRSSYRELFVGAGLSFQVGKVLIIEEAIISRAFGSASGRATYLFPWTEVKFQVAPKVRTEIVYFPYFPLNDAGRIQHILERAKMEYDFRHFRLGGGYGGFRFGDADWQHKPFLSATLKGELFGNLEFWLQRVPAGAQVQFRYVISR